MFTVLHQDRQRAGSFGADAARYDRARPGYPPALIDALLAHHPANALDVGCGTGIATRALAGRGVAVLGLEPDPRMAEVARRRGSTVEVATLEGFDAAGRTFDLVTCAQAWHWVDPEVGAARAAGLLAPGGRLGVFWNIGAPDPVRKAQLDAVYARHAPGLEGYSVVLGNDGPERYEAAAEGLRASGRFDEVSLHPFDHERRYTTEGWLDHLGTHSDHATLDPAVGEALFAGLAEVLDRAGGGLLVRYRTWLVLAR